LLAARTHGSGGLNGSSEQQQLFGQGRLTGVGMRDDGEGAPKRKGIGQLAHAGFVPANRFDFKGIVAATPTALEYFKVKAAVFRRIPPKP
jgi:hypothetical protein